MLNLVRSSVVAKILLLFLTTFGIFLILMSWQFRNNLLGMEIEEDFAIGRLMSEIREGLEAGQTDKEVLQRKFVASTISQNPNLTFYAYYDGRELAFNMEDPLTNFVTPEGVMKKNHECNFEGGSSFKKATKEGDLWITNMLCSPQKFYFQSTAIEKTEVAEDELFDSYWVIFGTDLIERFWLVLFLFIGATFILWRLLSGLTDIINISAEKINLQNRILLPEEGVPIEVRPLIQGVNQLLKQAIEMAERERFFLAAAAHELRTPLTVLRTRLEELPDSALRAKIIGDVQQLSQTMQQLLKLAGLKSNKLPELQITDLRRVAGTVCRDMAIRAHELGVSIDYDQPGQPVLVRCIPELCQVAISNLTENALSVSPKDSTITITVFSTGIVQVVDQGGGVPSKVIDEIFEPFSKSPPNRKGSGLGLAIVNEIMRHHGGEVSVLNDAGGAVFECRFQLRSMSETELPAMRDK